MKSGARTNQICMWTYLLGMKICTVQDLFANRFCICCVEGIMCTFLHALTSIDYVWKMAHVLLKYTCGLISWGWNFAQPLGSCRSTSMQDLVVKLFCMCCMEGIMCTFLQALTSSEYVWKFGHVLTKYACELKCWVWNFAQCLIYTRSTSILLNDFVCATWKI